MSTVFRQKQFSEYDAMRQLYVELKKLKVDRNVGIINTNQLISTLRGNNIVIEKFTQATRVFGKDRYRMYIKIGARAKMPDEVRLPQYSTTKSLGNLNLGLEFGFKTPPNSNQGGQSEQKGLSEIFRPREDGLEQREFGKNNNKNRNNKNNNKNKNNNGGGGGNGGDFLHVNFKPSLDFLNYEVHRLLGEAIEYNKAERRLVLEFQTIEDAINALNILPFGLGYNIYLLNA